jgi:hypothetical protein
MSDQFWLTKAQLKRIEPVFPRTRGIPRPACVTGIVHVIRTAMAMAEGYACESACGGLPSNPQHNFSARMPFESLLKCLGSLLERQHGVHESV